MTIARHLDPHAFLAAAAPLRARSAATDALVHARVLGADRDPQPAGEPRYFATYAREGSHGLAMQEGRFPVLIEDSDPAAAAAFAEDLAGARRDLSGVVGSLRACETFARVWRDRTGRGHALRHHMRQHVLKDLREVPVPPGAARGATAADAEWLFAAECAFVVEARVPAPGSRTVVERRIAQDRFRIWEHRGRAAYLGYAEAGPDAARVGPVYTPPERRRNGYATALVAATARELLGRGLARLFLTTDVANPTSNAIYARIGFRPLEDTYFFDFVDPA